MSRRRFRVTGRVQGVGFRWFVAERAAQLGLDGWVRNDADGALTVLASGPEAALDALAAALAEGPRAARVAAVEAVDAVESPAAEAPPPAGFRIV